MPQASRPAPARSRHLWRWIAIGAAVIIAALVIGGEIALHRATPTIKNRIVETLSTRFHARVELAKVDVALLRGLEVSGGGLRIYETHAASTAAPLISIGHFSFHSGVIGLLQHPMHVSTVKVDNLDIELPPHGVHEVDSSGGQPEHGNISIVVHTIICDKSKLVIGTDKPDKDPKQFDLKHIELHEVGGTSPWQYQAVLTNAVPPGDIHASGAFGPWQPDSPGESPVTGRYTFTHADLGAIKGIAGTLSSTGDFKGRLNNIEINGTTETPNFALDTGNHPMPLATRFRAVVDGTSGDTYLKEIRATLGSSKFTTSGAVVNHKHQGHSIELDIDVPGGELQDFLNLAVHTEPPVMSGIIGTKSKLHIPPGDKSVVEKIAITGNFNLSRIHFSSPKVQDKVDMLSLRARGKPNEAKPGASDVSSQMTGTFAMRAGVLHFSKLMYVLPGARVNLTGDYSLDGRTFDFQGKVRTRASLSQMVASPWKSLLLKAASPFFSNGHGGAEIPVSISGTNSDPKFGLDLFGR